MWRTVVSEWGKTWSVRAPSVCLAGTVGLVLVSSLSLANDFIHRIASGEQPPGATMAVVDAVGPGLQTGQLVFVAFALQLITAEYSTGAIRSTLQAQPRRAFVLLSKAAIAAACGSVLGGGLGALAAWAGRAVLGPHAAPGSSVLELALRSAALLAFVAVIGVGLGAALRSAVGTLAVSGVLLLGTLALPSGVGRWAPGQAGAALMGSGPQAASTVAALLVLGGWAVAAAASGSWLMRRRDA
jgi:ABC-2 type transport system permease protein